MQNPLTHGDGLFVLSLDHGNIGGHSALQFLCEVMNRLNWDLENHGLCREWRAKYKREVLPHDIFHIIAGSGTGGLIAGLLSSLQMGAKSAMSEYLTIAPLLFPALSSPAAFPEKKVATKKLDAALQETIKKHHPTNASRNAPLIGKSTKDSSDGLILAHKSQNMRTQPALFRTYPIRGEQIECQLWEAFRATTADLGMGALTDIVINGHPYSGTSLNNGNPTEHLAYEVKRLYPNARVDLVLSLGAGFPETIHLPPGTSKDLYGTLSALAKDCEETQEKMYKYWSSLYRSAGYISPYYRLNVQQGIQGMEGKAYTTDISGEVVVHAEQTISEFLVSQQIDQIVKILVKRMTVKNFHLIQSVKTYVFPTLPTPVLPSGQQKRVLSLDSGGLLGISELILLEDILDGEDKRPFDYFDLIGGSGTGGIIAILLGRFKMTIKQAKSTFCELTEPLLEFILKDQDEALNVLALTKEFESILSKRLTTLSNEGSPMMFPFTADESDCKTFILCNSTHNMNAKFPRFFGTYRGRRSMCKTNASVLQAIRATTAGRDLFTDAWVGERPTRELFGGADCANNNPTYHAIEEAKRLWLDSPPPYVVSLGAGQVGKIALPETSTQRTQAFYKVLKKICADCETVHQDLTRTQDPSNYHRFNVDHGLEDQRLWSLMAQDSATTNTFMYTCKGNVHPELIAVGDELKKGFRERLKATVKTDMAPQHRPRQ
ncbi:acyl transferase/acyl hydrolase/lysophospholipase [Flagelloscypha sp. PMI_526]|nr:acyl transferase/acyl hydrolase/lysophospholipase [Flagelloscypha sp. PMI_526]